MGLKNVFFIFLCSVQHIFFYFRSQHKDTGDVIAQPELQTTLWEEASKKTRLWTEKNLLRAPPKPAKRCLPLFPLLRHSGHRVESIKTFRQTWKIRPDAAWQDTRPRLVRVEIIAMKLPYNCLNKCSSPNDPEVEQSPTVCLHCADEPKIVIT